MPFREMLVSIISSATLLSSGMHLGFSAVSLPHMQDPAGTDRLTVEEGSWFASLGFISVLAGCLTCGPLSDTLGRKKTLLVINTPFIIGWLLMWMAPKPAPVSLLYFARLLNGLGEGMVSIPANIYISEVASSSTRCMLVTWPSLAVSVGVLLVYALGLVIQEWRTIAAVSTFVPVLTAVFIIVFLIESPVWLLDRGRDEEAKRSFQWLRSINDPNRILNEFQKEFRIVIENSKMMKGSVKNVSQHEEEELLCQNIGTKYGTAELGMKTANSAVLTSTVCSTLKRSDVWKPLVILNCYFFFMQFSGIPVFLAYAVNIMISEEVSMEPYLATLLLGVVKILFEIAAGFVQNRCGRRPLSMGSGIGMAICMMGLGLHRQMTEQSEIGRRLAWLPLLLIFVYFVSAAMGFFLIPWAMLGEVYPTKVSGFACGFTTCLGNFFGFASIKLFPTFVALTGGTISNKAINCTEGVFYLYGGITCVAVVFIYLYLPETFRKTLQEISDDFSKPGIKILN